MGSKARLAKHFKNIFQPLVDSGFQYAEPFAGGMNMICEIDGKRLANDSNTHLIAMWEMLLKGWIPEHVSKEQYTRIRDNFQDYEHYKIGWVGFNCSYSGKFFAGYAGVTETKEGVRDYQQEAIKNVLAQVKKLQGVQFSNLDYTKLSFEAKTLIYCDPPYRNTTGYRTKFNHGEFYDWCRTMRGAGHIVYVSEYDMPSDFTCIFEQEVKSSLSANGKIGGSKLSTEKLFTLC